MTELEKLLYELDPTGTSKTFHVTKDTLEALVKAAEDKAQAKFDKELDDYECDGCDTEPTECDLCFHDAVLCRDCAEDKYGM